MSHILIPLACFGALLGGAHGALAQGSGVAVRWNNCYGGGGALARSFACNSNAGFEQLMGSFIVPQDMTDVVGNEITLDVYTAFPFGHVPPPAVPLPEWWKFKNPGTCRQTAASLVTSMDAAITGCEDWAYGQAAGGIGAYGIDFAGVGTARFRMVSAVPASALGTLAPSIEYFSFELRIRHDKTVGDGACSGCEVPLTLVLNSLKVVTTKPENDRTLYGPVNGTDSNFALWRPQVVPTRSKSWNALKALFR